MKTLLAFFFLLFSILTSSNSYGGLFGITSIEDATCEDLEKKAKGTKLTNAFGAKFKILQVKNSKEISRTKDKLVCLGDLKLDSGLSNSKLLMTLIDEDGEIWYEFKQEFNFTLNNNTESDSQIEINNQNSGEIIARSTLLEDILDCKNITDDASRLGCYDSLSDEHTPSNAVFIPSIIKLIKEKRLSIGGPDEPFYGCIYEITYGKEDPFTNKSEIAYISVGNVNRNATFQVGDFDGMFKDDENSPQIGDCFAFLIPFPMQGYSNIFNAWGSAQIYRGEYLVDEKVVTPLFKDKLTVDEFCEQNTDYGSKIIELTGIVKETSGKENKNWFRIQLFAECNPTYDNLNYISTYYDSDIWKNSNLIKNVLLSIQVGDSITLKGHFGGINGFEIIEILNLEKNSEEIEKTQNKEKNTKEAVNAQKDLSCTSSNLIISSGDCTNGYGTYNYADGDKYVGEFKNGKMEGQGTLTFIEGMKYIGKFENGKMEGQGTYTFQNGDVYVGEHKNNSGEGDGTFTFVDGTIYIGEFKNYNFDGQGTLNYANGDKHVGEFKNGQREGQGTLTFVDGTIVVGEYKNNKIDGQGILTYANGDKYIGEFKKGFMEGQGTLTFVDGRVLKGIWSYGSFLFETD